MIKTTKQIKFCASHRLYKYPGACKNIHGHNYLVEITVESEELNHLGMVIDFKKIKGTIQEWIDNNWDHAFIYYTKDAIMCNAFEDGPFKDLKAYSMLMNPTAENMAKFLLDNVCPMIYLRHEVQVTKVRVWETDTSYAEAIC